MLLPAQYGRCRYRESPALFFLVFWCIVSNHQEDEDGRSVNELIAPPSIGQTLREGLALPMRVRVPDLRC